MSDKQRRLKVQPKHFPRAWKDVVFPEIKLAGKWLQDLGFTCGSFVAITHSQNSITITLVPEQKKEPVIKKQRKKRSTFSPEANSISINELFRREISEDQKRKIEETKKAVPCGTAQVRSILNNLLASIAADKPFQPKGNEETNHSA